MRNTFIRITKLDWTGSWKQSLDFKLHVMISMRSMFNMIRYFCTGYDVYGIRFQLIQSSSHIKKQPRVKIKEGVPSTQRCYTVIVPLLNFVTRCLTTSWEKNNCPHDTMETAGGGSRRTITLPHLRTLHSACPSLAASSPVCQRRLRPLHSTKRAS